MKYSDDALKGIARGDPIAAEMLPLVYDDLHRMASKFMASEKPGQTLQPTALVHEAYLRLAANGLPPGATKGQFFCIAAEAMRRIIVESVRRKNAVKHGGGTQREALGDSALHIQSPHEEVLAVHEALDSLAEAHAQAAELVKLRYFAGFEMYECAEMLGISESTAHRLWKFAKAWLFQKLSVT